MTRGVVGKASSAAGKTGMSGRPSVSKLMVGTLQKRPIASLTAAERICHSGCSFSNLISVYVGWILTSMSAGATSK